MANKTTTLKTKTNDNVYPNIIGDNRDSAIVNSAHIKHTLTAEHKINFRLDDNVSNLIFNSLQKPAGLTKTKLVGVGTNGQENIEIGDNLTLANGKLSASGGGGGFNKYMIGHVQTNVQGPSGEHTYTIGEQVGFIGQYLTPPDDFNDGVCVLLGASCSLYDLSMRPIDFISTISGDRIYYITGARITKRKEKYYIELGAYTINSGTATMGSSVNSFASVMYAWIYK